MLARISAAVEPWRTAHTPDALRLADYAVVKDVGYPAYLGGPFTYAR